MKLALALVLVSAPVFACPHQDQAQKTAQTSEKKPDAPKKDDAKKPTDDKSQAKAKATEPAKKPS